jgi:hypothetical protein
MTFAYKAVKYTNDELQKRFGTLHKKELRQTCTRLETGVLKY